MSKSLAVPIPDYFYYFPKGNDQRTVIENRSSTVRAGKTEIVHELYSSDGIYVWYSNVNLPLKKKMLIEYPEPFIHINYALQCSSSYYYEQEKKPFATFHPLQYNILLMPVSKTSVEWMPGKEVENFEINLTRSFFENYLPDDHPFRPMLQNSDQHAFISVPHLPVTPHIRSIIYDIVHCTMEPGPKRLYLKAKTLELLSIQQQQQMQMTGEHHVMYTGDVKASDVSKMYAAREIIVQHLDKPHSLVDLAHMVGTNECYLKRNFKKVFGTTVYGHIQQLRMERARDVLVNEKRKISEVAKLSGYGHVSHFSKAFKKQFGFSPKNIKTMLCFCLTELYATFFSELSLIATI